MPFSLRATESASSTDHGILANAIIVSAIFPGILPGIHLGSGLSAEEEDRHRKQTKVTSGESKDDGRSLSR